MESTLTSSILPGTIATNVAAWKVGSSNVILIFAWPMTIWFATSTRSIRWAGRHANTVNGGATSTPRAWSSVWVPRNPLSALRLWLVYTTTLTVCPETSMLSTSGRDTSPMYQIKVGIRKGLDSCRRIWWYISFFRLVRFFLGYFYHLRCLRSFRYPESRKGSGAIVTPKYFVLYQKATRLWWWSFGCCLALLA